MRDDEPQELRGRPGRARVIVIAALLGLLVFGGALGAYVAAVQAGLLRPPSFSFEVGGAILAAPCPAEMGCPAEVPYYAVWQGERHPDGSTSYKLRYFTYLPRR